jgi:hypothetical protein
MYWGLSVCSVLSWTVTDFNVRQLLPFMLAMLLLPLLIRWLQLRFLPRPDAGPSELATLGPTPNYVYPYLFVTEDGRTFLDREWGPLYRRPNRNGRSKVWRDDRGLRLELLGNLAVLRFREDSFDEQAFLEVTVVNLPEEAKNPPPQGERFLELKSDGTACIIQLEKEGKV